MVILAALIAFEGPEFVNVWNALSRRTNQAPPRLPQGVRIYAVGDLHGRADLLESLLLQIEVDTILYPASRTIVAFLGDYIDRGPSSREVLELLARPQRHETVFLKGNHDVYVEKFLNDPTVLDEWRQIGGLDTLASYGLRPKTNPGKAEQTRLADEFANVLPDSHRKFLSKLELLFSCGDFFFVHAGIRPRTPIRRQKEEDLLWIRDDFLLCEEAFEKFVVHGHTPVREPDFRSNRINIDTGAFATGRLTCLMIDGTETVPLVDVRDWIRDISNSDVGRNSDFHVQVRSMQGVAYASRHMGQAAFKKNGSPAGFATCNPDTVTFEKIRKVLAGHDERCIGKLNPRPGKL
jgi:serine/threonine protein phosphatase 1